MTFKRLREILKYAKKVHKTSIRSQVDYKKNDKKHAIYLLQGGVLTAATNAFEFNSKGLLAPRAQQKRMIDEIVALIFFFDELSDHARQVKAWFNGSIVERSQGNKGNLTSDERASRYSLTAEQIQRMDSLRKQSNQIMSLYMHPTIEVIRSNVFKDSNVFDYDHERTYTHVIEPATFGNLYVTPALHSLLTPIRVLHLGQEEFANIRSHDNEIQQSRNEEFEVITR